MLTFVNAFRLIHDFGLGRNAIGYGKRMKKGPQGKDIVAANGHLHNETPNP